MSPTPPAALAAEIRVVTPRARRRDIDRQAVTLKLLISDSPVYSSWLERPAHIVLSGNLQNAVQLIIASRGLLSALQLQYGAEVRVQSAESREFEVRCACSV